MRRTLIGIVTGDQRAKTRRVEVPRQYRHPKYGKTVRARTVCHIHDEQEESKAGDQVEIIESRPHSKTKRWELLRIVKAATSMEVAAAAADASAAKEAAAAKAAEEAAAKASEEPAEQEQPETQTDSPESA